MKYVALLRGINVGGNNIIKMTALKACFEDMGFSNVRTVIASGNVLFESRGSAATLIPGTIFTVRYTATASASKRMMKDMFLS